MLVGLNMVDLSGTTCNKVGTSYNAFNNQPNACFQREGRCGAAGVCLCDAGQLSYGPAEGSVAGRHGGGVQRQCG